ncbi:MAG: hypothetical protein ACD_12C00718G0003 [uncultured bacterium]|nr:MAG: hypothetical protein ACD_12C00718G0003 [uncultured bacterium]
MSKTQQFKLNISLSDRLANYLVTQPNILNKYSGCSYVVFSYKNEELNKLNNQLIPGLKLEGKPVVKAQETNDLNNPWVLTPIFN